MPEADVKAIVQQIEDKYQPALSGDYFALLEVQEADPPETLKGAFFRLARVFHPDVLSRQDLDPRDLEKGRFVFKKLSEAYNTLTDNVRRTVYISRARATSQATAAGSGGEKSDVPREEPKRSADEEAEIFYHKAQILLRRGNAREAIDFMKRALTLRKDEPRYLLDLGWTIFQDGTMAVGERIEEARQYFEKVLEKQHQNVQAMYYMSLYHKARNEVERAYELLKDCLTIDPQFTPAKRELRLLRLRLKKEAERRKNPFYRLKMFIMGERAAGSVDDD
jgi:tetratricopeptide (TPR) repeat protein